jgi:serine phosphatase RsbU (regulator of sigma subunit)
MYLMENLNVNQAPATVNEVKGAFIMSAIVTLAEFRKLGESALAEQGVTQLEPHRFYPASLRRAIHSAIYDRFGTPGIFWVALETPRYFAIQDSSVLSAMNQATQVYRDALNQNSQPHRAEKVHRFLGTVLGALNGTIRDSVRGQTYDAGWFIENVEAPENLEFSITCNSTSHQRHEAFSRGILHFSLRNNGPDTLDFELVYLEDLSHDYSDYSSVRYRLKFFDMAEGQVHSQILANERSEAREALFKRALEHAMAQEDRATQALADLARSHQHTLESIQYAAALQRQQLPKPVRWQGRLTDLASLWEPKDVIGGDMWWVSPPSASGTLRLALFDCTGHGVPGAMLALLVSNTLERLHLGAHAPSLSHVIAEIQQALSQSFGTEDSLAAIDHGCEIILLEIDPQSNTLDVAMAGLGLMHCDAGTGNVQWLASPRGGISAKAQSLTRQNQMSLSFKAGDSLLLITDGMTDQIGSMPPLRALGYNRIEQCFKANHSNTAAQCIQALQQCLLSWQGDQVRRDDVSALVIKL